MRSIATAVLAAVVLSPLICLGQALSDRVPGDAVVYVGWKGTDSLGPAYEQSHLKAVLAASQLRQFVNDSIPLLVARVSQDDPQAGQVLAMVADMGGPLWRYPSAVYFGGVDQTNPNQPSPKLAILCQAGADAAGLAQKINALLTNGGAAGAVQCRVADQLVIVSTFAFPDHPQLTLSQNKDFQASVGSLSKDPVAVAYVDGVAANALADQLVPQFGGPQGQRLWPQVRQTLGVDGIKHIAWTAGFEGRNWAVQVLVDAPAPRHGLLALGDSQPLADELIRLIPQSADSAAAGTCDLDGLFTTISTGVTRFSPESGQQFQQGLAQLNQMLGLNVQQDLLAALGPQWAYYTDTTASGAGPIGIVVLNRPRNADQLQASLTKLEQVANGMLKQQLQNKVTVEIRQETIGGVTVHYFAVPMIAPAWAIKDGTLYVALYPQVLATALNRPAGGKSILENPGFQLVRKELGAPEKLTAFTFADLPRTVPTGYLAWLMFGRLYQGLGDLYGMQTPPLLLPPLDKLLAETEPAGSVSWSDDGGFHAKAITPFPGAEALSGGIPAMGMVEGPLLVGVMLPSLNHAREAANRVKCASNLKQIGMAIMLYSNENHGAYPPDLGTLVKTEDIRPAVFVCPTSGTPVPPGNLTLDQAADWVNANSSYVYVGAGLKAGADPAIVVAYEKDENHRDGMNILFADGHVDWVPLDRAHELIQQSGKGPGM